MFTGLIEEVGSVLAIGTTDRGTRLQIAASRIAPEIREGESVAVNGCCLTVTAHRGGPLTFDLLQETLDRTNLGLLRRHSLVNLERALPADGRIGGHFVQGHIDCTVPVLRFEQSNADHRLEIALPPEFAHYVAPKGSLTVNGISLTVAEMLPESVVFWIIPHTRQNTNLDKVAIGDQLNVEFDVLAKYVERMLSRPAAKARP